MVPEMISSVTKVRIPVYASKIYKAKQSGSTIPAHNIFHHTNEFPWEKLVISYLFVWSRTSFRMQYWGVLTGGFKNCVNSNKTLKRIHSGSTLSNFIIRLVSHGHYMVPFLTSVLWLQHANSPLVLPTLTYITVGFYDNLSLVQQNSRGSIGHNKDAMERLCEAKFLTWVWLYTDLIYTSITVT